MGEFKQQIPFDSFISIKDLDQIFREIVRQEFRKLKFDKSYPATIASTPSGGTADIKLQGGNTIIPNVKIRSGLTPSYGDQVYVRAINGSLNNLFIDETNDYSSVGNFTQAYFGDYSGGNYSEFESDGTYIAKGNATCFKDELGDITSIKVLGAGLTLDTTESTLDFSSAADLNDYAIANYQINHDWKAGSVIYPHVHFFQNQNAKPNALIRYRWQQECQPKTTAWFDYPMTSLACPYTSGTINQIIYGNGITPPVNYATSDILQMRLFRDNTNASGQFSGANAYTGDWEVTSWDIHLEIDTLGSRTQYTK